VDSQSNEMFSDFALHRIGGPQVFPQFGVGKGNVIFDGPGENEDFGAEQISGDPADRYKFRTAPLRNLALQPAFFHNGAFTRLEDAIAHHLQVFDSARGYDPAKAKVDRDLRHRLGPIEPVLERIDPLVAVPQRLSQTEMQALVKFVRTGLLDPRAKPEALCRLIPAAVPSGMPVSIFEGCK
jgi:cytochrome c peroxidase